MNPKWLPKSRAGKIARLTEECGEVLQCIGKIQRFGLDTRYDKKRHKVFKRAFKPRGPLADIESNREALLREIIDLVAAADAAWKELINGR